MDRSHKLDAPNNEELKTIEQIDDRSGLSTLYRDPGEQFEGTILSAEERDKVKEQKLNNITNGIWKSSLKIGLYLPWPLVSGSLLAVFLYTTVNWENAAIFLGVIILSLGAWGLTSYFAYAAIFKIFYKHALRAGPFIFMMLLSILLASQAFYYTIADYISNESLLFDVAFTSLLVTVYSIFMTFIMLLTWGSSKLKGGFKVAVSVTVLVISGLLLAASMYPF